LNNLNVAIEKTSQNNKMTLVLALSYSSKKEIVQAIQQIAEKVKNGNLNIDDINEESVRNHLYTNNIPDPELLIRTSGELRISNFLMWQIAYSELYFTKILWPDFRSENLYEALIDFQSRERRFGKTSEQIEKENA
jgi:undecaprenyl diphosphate synthase